MYKQMLCRGLHSSVDLPGMLSTSLSDGDSTISVDLYVRAPSNTPTDASLYVLGNFNGWQEPGLLMMLLLADEGLYYASVPREHLMTLSPPQPVRFKITLGSWETEAADCSGAAYGDAVVELREPRLNFAVHNWKHLGPRQYSLGWDHNRYGTTSTTVLESKGVHYTVRVWTPPDATAPLDPDKPLLVMLDGQNVFADGGQKTKWNPDFHLAQIWQEYLQAVAAASTRESGPAATPVTAAATGAVDPAATTDSAPTPAISPAPLRLPIILAVESESNGLDRFSEYDLETKEGRALAHFLHHVLFPWAETQFGLRTGDMHASRRWIMGSSMGGHFAVQLLLARQYNGDLPHFGKAAALSLFTRSTLLLGYLHRTLHPTSVWKQPPATAGAEPKAPSSKLQLYIDHGTDREDWGYDEDVAPIASLVRRAWGKDVHLLYRVFELGCHEEFDWDRRLRHVLRFLISAHS